ncbi:hypothetical protein yrohd0001_39520 [Yersinia rohdei ATCC 43380]|nr:hypothetical protein yrohd0001_39520 [Yersinia rohdei ATCC 43380]
MQNNYLSSKDVLNLHKELEEAEKLALINRVSTRNTPKSARKTAKRR